MPSLDKEPVHIISKRNTRRTIAQCQLGREDLKEKGQNLAIKMTPLLRYCCASLPTSPLTQKGVVLQKQIYFLS